MTQDLKRIVYSLHPLARKVLPFVKFESILEISKQSGLSETEVMTAVNMLVEKEYAVLEKLETSYVGLDKLGHKFLKKDLPEISFLKQILHEPKIRGQLKLDDEEFSAAIGILKRKNLIEIRKAADEMLFSVKDKVVAEEFANNFGNPLFVFAQDVAVSLLSDEQKEVLELFKSRKGFLKEFSKVKFEVILTDKGKKLTKEIEENYLNLELLEVVDSDLLKSGIWKGKEFRYYDVGVDVPIVEVGRRHPMVEANNILRDVFVEMGFREMSGPMVESAFWNMDVMWIPQDHPARDEQDTFYLEGEAKVPADTVKKVRKMHEEGLKRTHTLKDEWSEDITKKRLLRTHSTATSFRTLAGLGEKLVNGEDIDGKYFYVANNFRNEAIDATHLAEFFQAEGFIVADDLSLADLMGFIREYYAKLGITQIRFKPTFNPYTEPSMEAHYYDPKLKKWYALINSGIFRPETLKPFGLEKKRIIAWGMGASRVATLLSGKQSMREITGATCDFEWLKSRPLMKREIVKR